MPSLFKRHEGMIDISHLDLFLEMLTVERMASRHTLEAYERDLRYFFHYTKKTPDAVTHACLSDYFQYLTQHDYAASSRARHLSCLRQFFHFLLQEGVIMQDPTALMELPKKTKRLPGVLTEENVEALLSAARDWQDKEGVRLVFLLELLYATGLRVSELVSLPLAPFERLKDTQTLSCITVMGKGQRERMIPLPFVVLEAFRAYCFFCSGGL